ncbi:MAG TPA: hypothetical protein VMT61_16670 [Candidatus Binataceae bacterium]|nr:hypothetical protein [Candidatus Binataceae bacterium]
MKFRRSLAHDKGSFHRCAMTGFLVLASIVAMSPSNSWAKKGLGGDDKFCLAHLGRDGSQALDTKFTDELTGNPCVDFDRPTTYLWPSGRGGTGNAKPHAVTFIHLRGKGD